MDPPIESGASVGIYSSEVRLRLRILKRGMLPCVAFVEAVQKNSEALAYDYKGLNVLA